MLAGYTRSVRLVSPIVPCGHVVLLARGQVPTQAGCWLLDTTSDLRSTYRSYRHREPSFIERFWSASVPGIWMLRLQPCLAVQDMWGGASCLFTALLLSNVPAGFRPPGVLPASRKLPARLQRFSRANVEFRMLCCHWL